jgi:hypothetical protein
MSCICPSFVVQREQRDESERERIEGRNQAQPHERHRVYQTDGLSEKRAIGKRMQDMDCTLEQRHDLAILSSEFEERLGLF